VLALYRSSIDVDIGSLAAAAAWSLIETDGHAASSQPCVLSSAHQPVCYIQTYLCASSSIARRPTTRSRRHRQIDPSLSLSLSVCVAAWCGGGAVTRAAHELSNCFVRVKLTTTHTQPVLPSYIHAAPITLQPQPHDHNSVKSQPS